MLPQDNTEGPVAEMAAGSIPAPGLRLDPNASAPEQLPAWLADADQEELAELQQLGVVASPEFRAEAERDDLVSRLMRAHHEHSSDVERYDQAEALEHAAITRRYDRLRAPAKAQLLRLASFIIHLVSGANFTGRKKSRDVGWGSYGLRKQPDKVEVADMLEVVRSVSAIEPQAVSVELVTNIDLVNRAQNTITKLLAAGATLDGSDASTLSEVRAALLSGKATVSKATVGRLLKVENDGEPVHTISGASMTIGTDKPWFETEPPTHG